MLFRVDGDTVVACLRAGEVARVVASVAVLVAFSVLQVTTAHAVVPVAEAFGGQNLELSIGEMAHILDETVAREAVVGLAGLDVHRRKRRADLGRIVAPGTIGDDTTDEIPELRQLLLEEVGRHLDGLRLRIDVGAAVGGVRQAGHEAHLERDHFVFIHLVGLFVAAKFHQSEVNLIGGSLVGDRFSLRIGRRHLRGV